MLVLNIIYVVAAMILLFGAAVFVHEYGHYWMALRRGLKIEGFSIGFGPKIVSWMRDGVEWSWRWIPAGGFVKLPQMVTSDALEGKAAEPVEQLPAVSPWSKILVAVCRADDERRLRHCHRLLPVGSRNSRSSQPAHHRLR